MWAAAMCFATRTVLSNAAENPRLVVAEKHASELDLKCESYEDGVDWAEVRRLLFVFLARPSEDHEFLNPLLALGRTPTDCYIGLCCLGYLAIFMNHEKRSTALVNTLFGSVPLWDQIPLSYWEIVGTLVRKDPELSSRGDDGCCDFFDQDMEQVFQDVLTEHLASGAVVRASASTRYLAESFSRCSFGKASAYLALAERFLQVESPVLTQASKDFMALGEAQLDRCAVGRNVTIFEQMLSLWPFWGLLRRVEVDGRVQLPSEKLRVPPEYVSPTLRPVAALHHPEGARQLHGSPRTKPATAVFAQEAELGPEPMEPTESRSCEARGVHVALSGDGRHMEGLLAVIQSLILGTKFAKRVCVHVFALQIELTGLLAAFRCSFQTRLQKGQGENNFLIDGVAVAVHIFSEAEVLSADLVVDEGVTAETGDLNAPHNFVRFYLGRWIRADRIIYLDTDVIVKGDVCELHDLAFSSRSEAVLAAVPRRHLPLSFYLKVFSPKMPIWVPSSAPSFNAGVMVIDMKRWEHLKVTEQVLLWAKQNGAGRDLWRHGSQPPLLLLLYDRVEWIPDVWNVDGLGHGNGRSEEAIQDAKILHWTGPLKPWLSNGLRKDLWEPFKVHC